MTDQTSLTVLICVVAIAIVFVAFKMAPYFKNGSTKYLSTLGILNLTGEIYLEVSKTLKEFDSIDVEKYKSSQSYRKEVIDKAVDKVHDILKANGYDLEREAPVIHMLTTQAVEKFIDSITIDRQKDEIDHLEHDLEEEKLLHEDMDHKE